MCKIIIFILLITAVYCFGFHREQAPVENKSEEDNDKYDLESKKDFDRTSEKEKELKLLRKAKKTKDNSYRRALETVPSPKTNESYRRLLEDLRNDSEEKLKLSKKDEEEVEVPNRRAGLDSSEDSETQVEEIEVIIERLSDDYNENDTNNASKKPPLTKESKSLNSDSSPVELEEKSVSDIPTDLKNDQDPTKQNRNGMEEMKERMGLGFLSSIEQLDGRSLLEPYPISRISEVVIPHYRTMFTRGGMIVRPAIYTVQTSSPIVDRVTARSLLSNRRLLPDIYNRLTNNKIGYPNQEMKLIEDYNDNNANAYSYVPTHALAWQNGESVSPLTEGSLNSQLGVYNPYRDSLHPSTFHSQPQRYISDSFKPLLRVSH